MPLARQLGTVLRNNYIAILKNSQDFCSLLFTEALKLLLSVVKIYLVLLSCIPVTKF